MLAGGIIDFNRGAHGHAAGFRTTILVGLSAAIALILTNILLATGGKTSDSFATMDPMRLPRSRAMAIAGSHPQCFQGSVAMARAGAEGKALILLVTIFPQCVVSMLSMTPPVMANQIAGSLGLSPQIAGVYVGLVYAGATRQQIRAAPAATAQHVPKTSSRACTHWQASCDC